MRAAAEKIVIKLQQAGFETYFAGGCVRDRLRGVEPHDYDVATAARPDAVEALFPGRSDLVGKSFGVVRVRVQDATVEVATFRQDGLYLDGRRPSEVTFTSAEEDAKRRDFTVNALFCDPVSDRIVDFVGGRADLEKKLLRAVGDPAKRFGEDRLRLLRGVRLASTLGFEIEPETWSALRRAAPQIGQVSAERVREELSKWLCGQGSERGLDLLDASGLLVVLLPEVAAMKGVEQPPQFHPEGDVFVHTRLMLSLMESPSETLAWAVLLHDIGKPPTRRVDETGRPRFNGHETVGGRMAEKMLMRLRFSNEKTEAICAMVANHMTFKDAPQMRLSTLKKLLARPTFDEELELHRLDCLGSHGQTEIYDFLKTKLAEMPAEAVRPDPFVRGGDLLAAGLAPGPRVGELLRQAYDLQLEGKISCREEGLGWVDGLGLPAAAGGGAA